MKKLMILCMMLFCLTGCSKKETASDQENMQNDSAPVENAVSDNEDEDITPDAEAEPLPTNAPFPEADFNAVTFDDEDFSFISVINDDDTTAEGTLSVENIDGNFMLKFEDDSTTAENLDTAVQKIRISVGALLRPDQFESVESIAFDLYAQAKSDLFLNDDGEYRQVPGWIGGGGGTMCADGNWYSFADFSSSGINEYDLERSDACHVEFKFLLSDSGKKWDSTVEDVNFSVMRWGMQNISDFYLDNIVFYDAEGNSIPLSRSEVSAEPSETEEIS